MVRFGQRQLTLVLITIEYSYYEEYVMLTVLIIRSTIFDNKR